MFVFGCMETRFALVLTSGAETGRCSELDPGVLGWRPQGHNHGGLARQLTPGCCLLFVSLAQTWSWCCRTFPHLLLLLLSLLGQIKPGLGSLMPRAPGCASTLRTCRSLLRSRGKKAWESSPLCSPIRMGSILLSLPSSPGAPAVTYAPSSPAFQRRSSREAH